MSRPLPEVRALARRLVEWTSMQPEVTTRVDAAERVLHAFRARLKLLVGPAGFNLMLTRALKRARDRHVILQGVRVEENGARLLAGLAAVDDDANAEEVVSAVEAVIAELIRLIARLLGADMAVRLVRQSLPDAPLGRKDSAVEGPNDE